MSKEKTWISLIRESEDSSRCLEVITIDDEDGEVIPEHTYQMSPKDISAFFKHMPCFINYHVKAVILQIIDFHHRDFNGSVHFRESFIAELVKHKIPYRVLDLGTFFVTSLFIGAGINCQPGDTVLTARIGKNFVSVTEFFYEKDGFVITSRGKEVIQCPKGYSPAAIKNEIFGSCNPKKIIIAPMAPSCPTLMKEIRKLLKSKKLIAFESCNIRQMFFTKTLMELAKMILDPSYIRYKILPNLYIEFFVDNVQKYENEHNMKDVICDLRDSLPWQKTLFYARSQEPCYLACTFGGQDIEIIKRYELPKIPHHIVQFDLSVDLDFLPKLIQTPYTNSTIEELPKVLKSKFKFDFPVIVFFGNSSVICVWNETEKCYKFCENWNGLFGEDLYISFDAEKPKYRNAALEVLKEKPNFVVYEVIRIMAMFIGIETKNPNWKFSFTKDDDNPILVEFENFEGLKKSASPEFLMALLLKDHLKAIKKETGKKPTKLGMILLNKIENENYKEVKWNLVEAQISEACKLLEIENIFFYC